jgi:hypothetical protein
LRIAGPTDSVLSYSDTTTASVPTRFYIMKETWR